MWTRQILLSALIPLCAAISAEGHESSEMTTHGFKLLEKRFVKEVNADCLVFEHVKSGAHLLKIAADDPNKTFAITFRTIPDSDCGQAHILEHSVLDGSRKFAVKSPFDILIKGSLNSFLNAMTGSDSTWYPVASMNEKDYFNLMDVYMDAVLHPNVVKDKRIFMQEGWHRELNAKDEPITYKGVVYNEMKGSYSNPVRRLHKIADKELFPDNAYGFESGGDPEDIPSLTYEKLQEFHKKHYVASNSYIFLYGNAPLDKELALLDGYLSESPKETPPEPIPLQKAFAKRKVLTDSYSVPEGAKLDKQSYISLFLVAGEGRNPELRMALDLLADVLANRETAPLRLAFQKAKLGEKLEASSSDAPQNVFTVTIHNANPDDAQKFLKIYDDTLKEVAERGVDKTALEGSLNRLEFHLREGDDAQLGLRYLFMSTQNWMNYGTPFIDLEYEKVLAKLKDDIKHGYLEEVIRKYLLDNPHSILLTLNPKPGLEKEADKKVADKLAAYKASLSQRQLDDLLKETKELVEYQQSEDSPEALASIPTLELKDINPKAEWENLDIRDGVLYYKTFCNGIIYSKLYFNAQTLPQELIPYASLLSSLLGKLETANSSFERMDSELNLQTGGFGSYFTLFLENSNDKALRPKFVLWTKCLAGKTDNAFGLMAEIAAETKFSDKERLRTLISRLKADLDGSVKSNGIQYAITRLSSYLFNSGCFKESTTGLSYYWFIKDLAENFDARFPALQANLERTSSLLFAKDNFVAACTCSASDYQAFSKGLSSFAEKLPAKKLEQQVWSFKPEAKDEGLLAASKVQYVCEGGDFRKDGFSWNGKMIVLSKILSSDILWNRLRVVGGAYGGFSRLDKTGALYLASYRDPNLKETLDIFDSLPKLVEDYKLDDKEMTRYIIGTIGDLDTPLSPSAKGDRAFSRYFSKTTQEEVQKDRDEVLACKPEDIRKMSAMLSAVLKDSAICVYGNEAKLKAERKLFKALVPLENTQQNNAK